MGGHVAEAGLGGAEVGEGDQEMEEAGEETEEEEEGRAEAFGLVEDRQLSANVKLASWCPTMDLLAVYSAEGRLSIHRLNWEPLW